MAFHLKAREDVRDGMRRMALAQLDCALDAAADAEHRDTAPHAIRKQCKKLRGLLRLVRGAFEDYAEEQRALRDAARLLAPLRDASAYLEALQRLCVRDPERYRGPDFDRARAWLQVQRDALQQGDVDDTRIEAAAGLLRTQRARAAHWSVTENHHHKGPPAVAEQ